MHLRASGLCLAAVVCIAAQALADQQYAVSGNDQYRIGQGDLQTSISYNGRQTLAVSREGTKKRFIAKAQYVRADAMGKVPMQATFVQELTPAGELQDRTDLDPDYLTVLNQPFAVVLDTATMSELLHLRGQVPFTFPAPMIGGKLEGYLQRGSISKVDSRAALAVGFDASGPMSGPLPDHSGMSIRGTMRMRGTAYYAVRGPALLLALKETLTISGTLQQHGETSPVTIVYERSIKATNTDPSSTEAFSH